MTVVKSQQHHVLSFHFLQFLNRKDKQVCLQDVIQARIRSSPIRKGTSSQRSTRLNRITRRKMADLVRVLGPPRRMTAESKANKISSKLAEKIHDSVDNFDYSN